MNILDQFNKFYSPRYKLDNDRLGFPEIGIVPTKLQNYNYWCTPINSICFAATGGDGENFSVLTNSMDEIFNAPVVFTTPVEEPYNSIVAANIEDFFRFGMNNLFENLSAELSKMRGTHLEYYKWDDLDEYGRRSYRDFRNEMCLSQIDNYQQYLNEIQVLISLAVFKNPI